ncbi:MAG: RusA family crossover junction endodeoxyribonuclease [Planctomycetota bacterium]|jgi:Holliday junction resolvase RusA-like endonuclease
MKLSYFVHPEYSPDALVLIVDVPPSLNNLYATSRRHGGRFMTAQGRQYKKSVGWLTVDAMMRQVWEYKGGRIALGIGLVFPNKRRRDISNCIKILEDAISEVLGFDDRVVDSVLVQRLKNDKENPHAIVTVEEYPSNHSFGSSSGSVTKADSN